MNDGIKLFIFVGIIAVVAVIFVKPLNERFNGLLQGDSKTMKIPKSQTMSAKSKVAASNVQKKGDAFDGKVSYDIKKIQSLLRKAGFYKGEIDGKVGPQTIKAIKQFQRSKKLKESGVINVKTWEELKKYETGR